MGKKDAFYTKSGSVRMGKNSEGTEPEHLCRHLRKKTFFCLYLMPFKRFKYLNMFPVVSRKVTASSSADHKSNALDTTVHAMH